MATIDIDGKQIEVSDGTMIIEAADAAGIYIPRFCFHKKLSIAANCRMCLVEVEKSGKPLPACATPVTDGMKVHTASKKAKESQRAVMEFLLINHPLDCPICDQGGECELQDLSLEYGADTSRFAEEKRSVCDESIGSLVETEMTRCIHCTRCVRFGAEIAGVRELGALNRGNHMEIRTAIDHTLESEVSGNIIDLCPVGALTSKPYRFQARGFELEQKASIAPHDCLGSNIYLHTRRNEVMRVVPRENEAINEIWLSDRDRFSYLGLLSEDRIKKPLVKKGRKWHEVSWQEALEMAVHRLKKAAFHPHQLGAVISPTSTLEEMYLLQKLIRSLGSHNVDHRLKQLDFRHQDKMPLYPSLGMSLLEVEQQDAVLLVGSHIHKEQPLLGVRLRKMQGRGGKIAVVNPVAWQFNFDLAAQNIVEGGDLVEGLLRVIKALVGKSQKKMLIAEKWLAGRQLEPDDATATLLLEANKAAIFLGHFATTHPQFSHIMALVEVIAELSNTTVGMLTEGPNSSGAWISGCVPHREAGGKGVRAHGLSVKDMWQKKLSSYVLMGIEPDLDCAHGSLAMHALQEAEMVIALSSYQHPALMNCAHIILPITPFSETAGTFVNIEGSWQTFKAATNPLSSSKPAWKILKQLATELELEDFDFSDTEDILQEVKMKVESHATSLEKIHWSTEITIEAATSHHQIIRLAPIPLYATDALVRRSYALQKTPDATSASIQINSKLAKSLKVEEGQLVELTSREGNVRLPVVIDEKVPMGSAVIMGSDVETVALGAPYSMIQIRAGQEYERSSSILS